VQEVADRKVDPTCSLVVALAVIERRSWCRLGSNRMPVSPTGA